MDRYMVISSDGHAGLIAAEYRNYVDPEFREMFDVAGEEFMKNITAGVEQDLDIWKHKVHRANPVFCEGDNQLADYRKWARQFYSHPVGDARKSEGN